MSEIDLKLSNLDAMFPAHFSKKQVAVGKTASSRRRRCCCTASTPARS